jgi:hypothetical protein
MYLVAVIDWHSRFVVGWELSDTLETTPVLGAVMKANEKYGLLFLSPQTVKKLPKLPVIKMPYIMSCKKGKTPPSNHQIQKGRPKKTIVIISEYKIKRNNENVFFIESEPSDAKCPNCEETLKYHGRDTRGLRDATGIKKIYSIRILKCLNKSCPTTYHRELPDIIIPYKRYDAESIEEAVTLNNMEITVAADQSTIYRWRKWFKKNGLYIMMALLSVSASLNGNTPTPLPSNKNQNPVNPLDQIKTMLSREKNWLGESARILTNASKWVFNRSAFLSG